ncbi:MAG: CHASE3 domain-containing protein [Caulobacteraceae bacterium]
MPASTPSRPRPTTRIAPLHTPWVRGAIATGFLLLVAAAVGTLVASERNAADERLVAETLEVRRVAASLYTEVQGAESAQRGYLLTGVQAYLSPLHSARRRIPPLETRLGRLTSDNPAQAQRFARLVPLVSAKMATIAETLVLDAAARHAESLGLMRSNRGRELMVDIREGTDAIDAAEARLLAARLADVDRSRATQTGAIVGALALAVLLTVIVAMAARRYSLSLEALAAELRAEIARRETTEAQLRQAQKMEAVGQLTGGIAHDFNNMLAIILGNIDMLRRRMRGGEEKLLRLLDNAQDGAQRAAALTRRLLAFSRLQSLAPATLDVGRCVADMSELLRRTLGEAIVVHTVVAPDLWRAYIDATQLESAILNLAVNAKDAMPGGGTLTLAAANVSLGAEEGQGQSGAAGDFVHVSVADTGSGMTSEVLRRAFDPFFTTKPVGAGTGLGLSGVYGFVNQSGGRVTLASAIGTGSTVNLYLPRSDAPLASAAVVEPAGGHADARPAGARVLVVEDEAGVRAFAVEALRGLGYRVLNAADAAVALNLIDRHEDIALMLTDVVMPAMNGRRLAEEAIRRRPALKVVYMTGYAGDEDPVGPGARLIRKPFTVAELGRELREALARPPAPEPYLSARDVAPLTRADQPA